MTDSDERSRLQESFPSVQITLLSIVQAFALEVLMTQRYVPSAMDALAPFFIGILEFIVNLLSPEIDQWLVVLAAAFGYVGWTVLRTWTRSGGQAFDGPQSFWLDSGKPVALFVASFLVLAALVKWQGSSGWTALIAVCLTNLVMLAQMLLLVVLWGRRRQAPSSP